MLENILSFRATPYLIVAIIFPIYLINVMPEYSWVAAGVDHFDFIFAAKYHTVAHSTGFPAYIIPANLVLMLMPNAHPAWALAFVLSTIPALINLLLVFYITKKLLKDTIGNPLEFKRKHVINYYQEDEFDKRYLYFPYIAMLTLAGAGVVLAQVFIVEVYILSITFVLTTVLFHVHGKYKLAAIFMGLAVASHGLIWTMVFLIYLWHWKKYFKLTWIIAPFAIAPYFYLPWALANTETKDLTVLLAGSWKDYIDYFTFGSSSFWWGNLPVVNFPERILDSIILFSTSLGLVSLGLFHTFKNDSKKYLWFIAFLFPTLYYWFGTAVQIVHVHLALAIPFLIILGALGLRYSKINTKILLVIPIIPILLIPLFWDIGRIIDKNLSAQTYYDFLDTVSNDNHILLNMTLTKDSTDSSGLLTDGTAIWGAVLLYNKDNNRNLLPVSAERVIDEDKSVNGEFISIWYKRNLTEQGIITEDLTIRWDKLNENWFLTALDTTKIIIPETIVNNCSPLCDEAKLNINQFQLWWTVDRLTILNPNKIIHLVGRTGEKERVFYDILYSREVLENNIPEYAQAIEDIYNSNFNYSAKIN